MLGGPTTVVPAVDEHALLPVDRAEPAPGHDDPLEPSLISHRARAFPWVRLRPDGSRSCQNPGRIRTATSPSTPGGYTSMSRRKITVVGAGNAGATAAQRLAARDYADIVLVDIV